MAHITFTSYLSAIVIFNILVLLLFLFHLISHTDCSSLHWRWAQERRGGWAQVAELALSSGRMHLSPVGTNRRCFLASSALCAIVLLLIPTLQTPQRQGELPRPLPRTRPARGENATGDKGASNPKDSRVIGLPFPSDKSQRDSIGANFLSSRSREPLGPKDIFIAVKTTRKYHKSRLELLFQTWVSKAKEQVRHTLN